MQIQKAIEIFLEKNNLTKTLQTFKAETKKSSNHYHSTKTSQLANIHKFVLNNSNAQEIRDHYQKTDPIILKKAIKRIKKNQKNVLEKIDTEALIKLPFFQKIMEKENLKNQPNTQNQLDQSMSDLCESRAYLYSLEESFIDNQWDQDPTSTGYETFDCPPSEFQKVSEQFSRVKNLSTKSIKKIPFPQQYYQRKISKTTKLTINAHDHKKSKLPPKTRFPKQSTQTIYPLEDNEKTYDIYNLKIIYNREKTGFQEERQLPIVINQVLAGRYQVLSLLGQAQFSKAISVKDLTNDKQYCIKIIQNNKSENSKEYFDQSIDQIKLLRYISANCKTDETHLLTLYDYFYHKEHLMLVTELLKENLLDAPKLYPKHFDIRALQNYSKQILIALEKLHALHIIHTDLKPENILIKSYSKQILKVIDLGSGIFFHDPQSYIIQTISYRSPQVLLGCHYDDKIDIWSLGCILAELLSGEVLFEGDSQAGILAQIQGYRGPWPSWMLETGEEVKKYFTKDLVIFEEISTHKRKQEYVNQSQTINFHATNKSKTIFKIFSPKSTPLRSKLKTENKLLMDFISKCLKIDPSERMSAKQALKHPFIVCQKIQ